MSRRLLIPAMLIALAVALAACGGDDSTTTTTQVDDESGCRKVEPAVPRKVNLKPPKAKAPTAAGVRFLTNCGPLTIRFDPRAPKTAASFQHLVSEHAFDRTSFHRVSDLVGIIQGGDPQGDGFGGPGYSIDERPPLDLSYLRGTVAMAKTEAEPPGRSGSQFFIVTIADAGLPQDFALVGAVTAGLDTVDRIAALGEEGSDGPPRQPVVIEKASLIGGPG